MDPGRNCWLHGGAARAAYRGLLSVEMKSSLVDTSAYSAFMRGNNAIKLALQEPDELVFCPIVLGELLAGFRRGEYRRKNEQELSQFLSSPRVRIVGMNEETSDRYALILNSLRKAGGDRRAAQTSFRRGSLLATRGPLIPAWSTPLPRTLLP